MDISAYSPALWVIKNGFVNERNEKLEFKDHFFLFDIYADQSQYIVCKKSSQVGFSVAANLKVIHMAKYRKLSTIYTMPSDDDVSTFVQTKTNKIIQANPEIRKDLKLDNVQLKQIGDAFIHFKGTRSKSAPLSTTTDILAHDELDRSDLNIISQYRSRITFSKFRAIWEFSNPSYGGMGIDVGWEKSDKKEWFIKCSECQKEQFMTWESNVDEIRQIYVCKYCGKEITKREQRLGRWGALNPGSKVSGYHISQLMAPWLTASDLIKEKEDGGIEYFYNFILGEPCVVGDAADFRQMIADCWSSNPLDKEPFFMGIDIGIEKHYCLGSAQGIFEIGRVQSRQQVERLIEKYNPIVVMDAGPERTWAEEFKQKYPKLYLCFLGHDKDQAEMVKWGAESGGEKDSKNWGYVWADRNRTIDFVINEILLGKILFNVSRETLDKYIKHWESMRRVKKETALGGFRYVWETSNGLDHWVLATVYYWLARRKQRTASFVLEKSKNPEIIERTIDGFRMRDLKEIIEEQQGF